MNEETHRDRLMEDMRDSLATIKNQLRAMEWWARTTLKDIENLEKDIAAYARE
jgi:small-conductance mechanosensitive channel